MRRNRQGQVELPMSWRDALVARAARSRPEWTVTLHLSYNPRRLGPKLAAIDASMADVAAELELATSFEKRRAQGNRTEASYRLHTPRLWLLLAHVTGDDGVTVAQIVDAKAQRSVLAPKTAPQIRAQVYSIHDRVAFDLHRAHEEYEHAKAQALAAARHAAYSAETYSPHARLRADLDRRLLPEVALISLIAKREEVVHSVEARGEISSLHPDAPDGADVLCVVLEEVTGALGEDAEVSLEPEDGTHPIPAEVVEVIDKRVLLRPRRSADMGRLPRLGSTVTLLRQGEARGGALLGSIERTRRGEVVGDWNGLARLLVDPDSLPTVTPAPNPRVDRSLSEEQADAVRRALNTRQAFFIQGPPGTGKTTVITEIVRQLTSAGERVLVAAPMHVAVDEVLFKVRDERGIWPMRVAADARNIRAGLEHLRENALQSDSAERVRARLGKPREDWTEEITRLTLRRAALQEYAATLSRLAQARDEQSRLEATGERAALEGRRARLRLALSSLEGQIAAALAQAEHSEAAAALLEAEADEARSWLSDSAEKRAAADSVYAERGLATDEAEQHLAGISSQLEAAKAQLMANQAHQDQLLDRLTSLRHRYEGTAARESSVFAAYLGERREAVARLRRTHEAAALESPIAWEARRTAIESSVLQICRDLDEARSRQSQHDNEYRAIVACAEAARADARKAADLYASSRERAGFLRRFNERLGLGLLAQQWNAQVTREKVLTAIEAELAAEQEKASSAAQDIHSLQVRLAAAVEARSKLVDGRRGGQDFHRRVAAAYAAAERLLADCGEKLDGQLTIQSLLSRLIDIERGATMTALEGIPDEVRRELEALRAQCDSVRARVTREEQTAAAALEAASADLERTGQRGGSIDARLRSLAGDVESARAKLALCRDAQAEALDNLERLAVGYDRAQKEYSRLMGQLADTRTAQYETTTRRNELEGESERSRRELEQVLRRLAEVVARLDDAAERCAQSESAVSRARASVLELCEGGVPDDLAAADSAAAARVTRLTALLRLDGRWRQLMADAGTDRGEPVEELGRAVLEATNLVCSTTAGIAGSPAARGADFDTLILDEASRVVDVEFLVPAVRARRWILVGDERQLPPYVDQELEQHTHALIALRDAEREEIPVREAVERIRDRHADMLPRRPIRVEPTIDLAARLLADGAWDQHYREHLEEQLDWLGIALTRLGGSGRPGTDARGALLATLATGRSVSRFEKCVTLPQAHDRCSRLTVQRRMVAPIAELVNKPIYGGDYRTPVPQQLADRRILPYGSPGRPEPVVFYDTARCAVPARSVGTGFVNDREAELVVNVLHGWDSLAGQAGRPAHPSYSVLAFYKAQAALIDRMLNRRPPRHLVRHVVDSIDRIQGQESDLIVISFVRSLRGGNGRPRAPRPNTMMWLQDTHRLNVAVTRARLALALIGDRPTLSRLRGDPGAEDFYAHLFELLDSGAEGMRFVGDSGL